MATPEKEVYINDVHVGYGTNAKVTPNYETDETPTFDGPVIDGTDEPSHEVTIDKLRYGTIDEYVQLETLLMNMQSVGYPIKIIERVQMKDGLMVREDIVYDCKLDNNEFELKADERTAEGLSFKGGKKRTWINGNEIQKTV